MHGYCRPINMKWWGSFWPGLVLGGLSTIIILASPAEGMGGMMAATFLAVFFVPLFFYWLTERKLSEKRSRSELANEISEHHKRENVDTIEGNL